MKIFASIRKKIACTLLLTGFTIGLSCGPTAPTKAPPRKTDRRQVDTLTVFITGNTLGELKPCGCSGGQLGGFDRRFAVFNSVPAEKRMIVDTGALVRGDAQQDLIKFNISIQALSVLNYDVVNLTEKDVEISRNLGLLDDPILGLISPHPAGDKISRISQGRYFLNGEPITINVLTFDVERSPIEQIRGFFGTDRLGEKKINILLINQCKDAIIASISRIGIVDCVICPAVSDEPMLISKPDRKPLVFSAGRYGRYIGKLQIEAAQGKKGLKFNFQAVAVKEDLKQDVSLINLYKDYQQLVKDANLLEEHPRFILPNGLKYAGSESCSSSDCHAYEYIEWTDNIHASAYATLEEVGSQYDPECVVCHVIGMDYESGFISEQQTPHLKDVGCENCHGPGSEHNKKPHEVKTSEPKMTCIQCHTPEHSSDYAGNEEAFKEKIKHWREPNAASSVK
ncbi:multiheme c-type cytochrome [Planctomycetota bacterium]